MDELLTILEDLNPEVDFAEAEDLLEKGLLDSFDLVTLAAELDDRFGVEISAGELIPENFHSAAAIWAMVLRLQGR